MSLPIVDEGGARQGQDEVPITRRPAWVERVPIWKDDARGGRETHRLIFIYRAIGCAWARQPDGGCRMCGFAAMTTGGVPVAPSDLMAQLDGVLDPPPGGDNLLDDVAEVDLYNSGSFLADQEIPPEVRAHALGRLGQTAVEHVLVEARAEHVREDKVRAMRAMLRADQRLEVGIGLESADDHVRDVLINKGFGRDDFERAVEALGAAGADLLAYVLIKPEGLEERAAIEDAVATARYVFDVAWRRGVRARVALEPTFVPPGTALEKALAEGRYTPPSLWSVIEVVRRAHAMGELVVGMSDEGLAPHRVPVGCPRCTERLRAALRRYNRTRSLSSLDGLVCDCMPG